eukprot:NODE_5617_length_690_cov_2.472699_g4747_i0.p3 GENE.NODE_5617_length_690_cov_2.472699_g4747_i0~~NODE_5617_length_690_cov_2.472699_g4747_i0.p3  ORF type:complete len:87 (-),score=18.33 NODE_5617_length_690_cov_2.472699_g4747_i0:376-636(-)
MTVLRALRLPAQVGDGKEVCRGLVCAVSSPVDPDLLLVKRVVGLPGDTLSDSAAPVPPGHVWIEGDNARHSEDSRFFGPVPVNLIR